MKLARNILLLMALSAGSSALLASEPPAKLSPEQAEAFEKRVRPVLAQNCFKCHGGDKEEADLKLTSRAGFLKGSVNGPVVGPGKAAESVLIKAINYEGETKMPPDGKMAPEAIEAITTWIELGLPWPEEAQGAIPAAREEAWKNHWAFQPVRRAAPPTVKRTDWAQTPLDLFILAQLEASGLEPSQPADRRTLIRRATYDLTGLPPTAAEVDAFVGDASPDAYARLIERLLASPRYGERWGRYWLDIARYADTKGYAFNQDRTFQGSSSYRDWVIRALNEDLPYDQFLTQQIAADCLPFGDDKRPLAAMGFLTLGRWFLGNDQDIIDDRIDVLTRGTMGLTVSCARCHDHKYDPIPTADYYSLYGVFASSREEEMPIGPVSQEYQEELDKRLAAVDAIIHPQYEKLVNTSRSRVGDYLLAAHVQRNHPEAIGFEQIGNTTEEINLQMLARWRAHLERTERTFDPVLSPWSALSKLADDEFAAKAPATIAEILVDEKPEAERPNPLVAALLAGPAPAKLADVAAKFTTLMVDTEAAWQKALAEAREKGAPAPQALADAAREQVRQVLYGEETPTNLPYPNGVNLTMIETIFGGAIADEVKKARQQVDKWRQSDQAPLRALALFDDDHPRNVRIMLRGNRHNPGPEAPRQFLRALAGQNRKPFEHGSGRLELAQAIVNPNNPLTARVAVNRVWMHHFGAALMTTPSDFGTRSESPSHPELLDYLASRFMDEGWSLKTLHRWIMLSSAYQQASAARPEAVARDPENRLVSRMNRQRLDFEATRDSLLMAAGGLDETPGGKSVEITTAPFARRRTVYGLIDRQNLPGLFRSFDFANPDAHAPKRFSTTVPQQALFMLNSPFVLEQARLLSAKSIGDDVELPRRIERMYRQAYGRAPTAEETQLASEFINAVTASAAAAGANPNESGLGPWEQLAQALLVANEFVYID